MKTSTNKKTSAARTWFGKRNESRQLASLLKPVFVAFSVLVLVPGVALAQSVAWTQRVVTGPSGRSAHAMAYDSTRGVTVLFGGDTDTGVRNGETWEWNGTVWNQRSFSGPAPRAGHAMAYDSTRGVTVLFGGYAAAGRSADTWEWNGTVWTRRAFSGPPSRGDHAMAYDSARGVTVLFGGAGQFADLRDTWEWNGSTWALRSTGGPSARYWHAMAYDSMRGATLLFGGFNTNAMASNAETWEWNGTTWTQQLVTGPGERKYHAMAHDVARGNSVMFGGIGLFGDTWEFNGTTWTQQLISGPSPRFAHAMTFDTARRVIVLFGGVSSGYSAETWELGVPCSPSITDQPLPLQVCPTDTANFSVAASGSAPFTYQWRKGTVAISTMANPSAATAMLTLDNVSAADAGSYDCVVTNACGSATSNAATLTVREAPDGTVTPTGSVSKCVGDTLTMTVTPSGSVAGPFVYRWYSDGLTPLVNNGRIRGADTANLVIDPVDLTDTSHIYYCILVSPAGCVSANIEGPSVFVHAVPEIASGPASRAVCAGAPVSFAVVTSSGNPNTLNYEWRKNGQPIVGAPSQATFSIASASGSDAGTYSCRVFNTCGSATSNAATLTVSNCCPGCPLPCPADIDDGSGTGIPDGGVTIDDLLYYLVIFEVGELRADVDDGSSTGTPDGGVTIDDLLYYLFRFEAGC